MQALKTLEKVYLDPLRMVAEAGQKGAIFTHADLDAVFLNINVIATVNKKFLLELEAEHEKWPDVNYAPIIKNNAKQMKG